MESGDSIYYPISNWMVNLRVGGVLVLSPITYKEMEVCHDGFVMICLHLWKI